MRARQHKTPEYLRVNPMGKVPTLVDGNFVLWESHAIMAYLADRKPGTTLFPADARSRADVNRWLFWTSAHRSANIAILVNQRVIEKLMSLGDPDPALVGFAQPEFERFRQDPRRSTGDARLRLWPAADARRPRDRRAAHVRRARGAATRRVLQHPAMARTDPRVRLVERHRTQHLTRSRGDGLSRLGVRRDRAAVLLDH